MKFEFITDTGDFSVLEEIKEGLVDIVPGVLNDFQKADYNDLYLTKAWNVVRMGLVQLESNNSQIETLAVYDRLFLPEILKQQFNIIYYNNLKETLSAVINGKADGAYVNFELFRNYAENLNYLNLKFIQGDLLPVSMGVSKKSDPRLYSVLETALSNITKEEWDKIKLEEDSFVIRQTLEDNIKLNLITYAIWIISILVLIIVVNNSRRKKKHYLEIQNAIKKVKKADMAKTEFLTRMSHDMRTPLNGIMGLSEFGQQKAVDPEIKDYFEKIYLNSSYLATLVNDILDLKSAEAGKIHLNRVPYKYSGGTGKIESLVKFRAEQKNINLIFNIENNREMYMKIDLFRSQQVIVNLLTNAIKYTPVGGEISYSISFRPVNDKLINTVLKIKDNGVGISPDFQVHMYDIFSKEKNKMSEKEGGSGIGLAITKQIVNLMGGTIECKSELGKGTEFTVIVPTELITKEEYQTAINEKTVSSSVSLAGAHILICEDNEINSMIIKKMLEAEQVFPEFASDGFEGVEKARTGKYDIILMDIQMPRLNGLQATALIREFDKKTPIIALSANAYREDIEKSLKAGMNFHLAKPINKDLLISTIKKYL